MTSVFYPFLIFHTMIMAYLLRLDVGQIYNKGWNHYGVQKCNTFQRPINEHIRMANNYKYLFFENNKTKLKILRFRHPKLLIIQGWHVKLWKYTSYHLYLTTHVSYVICRKLFIVNLSHKMHSSAGFRMSAQEFFIYLATTFESQFAL